MATLAPARSDYMAITEAIRAGFQRLGWWAEEWSSAFRYRDSGYCVRRLMELGEPPNPTYRPRNHYTHPWDWGPD